MSRSSALGGCISRVWLVIINVLFLGLTVLAAYTGYTIYVASKTYVDNIIPANSTISETAIFAIKSVNVKDVSISIFTIAGLYGIATLFGLIGGCTGAIWFLSSYIVVIGFALIVSVGLGIFSVIKMNRNRNLWSSLKSSDWKEFAPITQDFVQQTFVCCGWNRGDKLAYTGPLHPFYLSNVTRSGSNSFSNDIGGTSYAVTVPRCADSNSASIVGCGDATVDVNTGMATLVTTVLIIAIIFGLVTIGTASIARKREQYKNTLN
ncbi:hypothetical protein O5D80_006706 [Batrachochytrium dendrobatidis]|nr:hypothetical protein O5D80_006706 [Batrachochytrium dendrobatidis]